MSRGWAHLLEKTPPTGGNESSAFDDSTNSVDNADVGSGLEAAINTAANGTYLINPSALTASKLDTATDTATSGTYSTDPSALTNGKIRSFATSIDPNGAGTRSSGTRSNAASLDTSNTSTPNLSVDASDPAHVTFTVSGLESDYSGGVTFTDSTSKSDVVPISGNGNYSANLSNLTNGTLTYLMTVSNPAGNVINVDPTTTLGDGSANAPAGTPQFPNLLNGYAVRPPWMVAGVDYAVGVPAGTALKDPTTLSGVSGISIDNSAHHVIVSGNNITISNIDFSLDGGWQLIVEGGQNLTVTNSNFAIGSNGNAMFNQVSANNTVFMYDTFNGNGRSDSLNDTVFNLSGGATIEYCLVENSPSDDVDYGYSNTIKYNVFANDGQLAGSHPDWLQLSNGTLTNQTVEYNTFIQTSGFSQGIGLYSGVPGSYSLTTANVSNNTIVTSASDPGVNYVFSTVLNGSKPGGGTGSLTGAASIQNNYIAPSGVNSTVFETVG